MNRVLFGAFFIASFGSTISRAQVEAPEALYVKTSPNAPSKAGCEKAFRENKLKADPLQASINRKIEELKPAYIKLNQKVKTVFDGILHGLSSEEIEKLQELSEETSALKELLAKVKAKGELSFFDGTMTGYTKVKWEDGKLILTGYLTVEGKANSGEESTTLSVSVEDVLNNPFIAPQKIEQVSNSTISTITDQWGSYVAKLQSLKILQQAMLPPGCESYLIDDCHTVTFDVSGMRLIQENPDFSTCDKAEGRFCHKGKCLSLLQIEKVEPCISKNPCSINPGIRKKENLSSCFHDAKPRGSPCGENLVCHRFACETPDAQDLEKVVDESLLMRKH